MKISSIILCGTRLILTPWYERIKASTAVLHKPEENRDVFESINLQYCLLTLPFRFLLGVLIHFRSDLYIYSQIRQPH